MSRNIVFCADGTWNDPYQDENKDHTADPTNVFKLFLCLDGSLSPDSIRNGDEQEKTLTEDGSVRQMAKYLHGVGDSRNPIKKILGGAFGAGVIARIVRGYTFISRNYVRDANIFIVGFSRGAYTARALAGMIASQGLLALNVTQDKKLAYRRGIEAWYRYRKQTVTNPFSEIISHLDELTDEIKERGFGNSLTARDLVPVSRIASVAVWDTVGAMGLPIFAGNGKRIDAFKFVDLKLSAKVTNGFQALALDERRRDFTPSLWDPAGNVAQRVFPGAHADVGGGYPAAGDESGLSDGALCWMIDRLRSAGVLFSDPLGYHPIKPDPAGVAHRPWAHAPWTLPGVLLGPRSFPSGVEIDDSVRARMKAGKVVAQPGTRGVKYQPKNLPPGDG